MKYTLTLRGLLCVLASLSLVACGGGSLATIGGTVSGLATGASVVLQDNDTDNLTVTANTSFVFPTGLAGDSSFNVTVLTQPAGQTCAVSSGSGAIDAASDPVTGVVVTCTTTSSLGGTVTGLGAGTAVTLGNAGVMLPVAANGAFAFPDILAPGTAYNVTVVTQPAGMACTVLNPIGVVVAGVMASVTVTCI
jgi:hypothetical protein